MSEQSKQEKYQASMKFDLQQDYTYMFTTSTCHVTFCLPIFLPCLLGVNVKMSTYQLYSNFPAFIPVNKGPIPSRRAHFMHLIGPTKKSWIYFIALYASQTATGDCPSKRFNMMWVSNNKTTPRSSVL